VPTDQPTTAASPVSPSDTPLPSATLLVPTDTPPPTDAPPPTHTPVPPTHTLPPSPTPPPTHTSPPPTPACSFAAQGLFAGLWQTYRGRLGCPLHPQPKAIQDAEQAFQNGHMFWRADNDAAYVVYEQGSRSGEAQAFSGMWSAGDPEYSCPGSPPPGLVQPKRGFGAVWCTLGGSSAAIGWGLAEEVGFGPGYGDPLVQDFERGVILRDSDGTTTGRAYVIFSDGTFVRVNY
jgi:hypothetical protein